MDRIINNFLFQQKLTCMVRILKKKNIQFNGYIFKICSHINFLMRVCRKILSKSSRIIIWTSEKSSHPLKL